MMPINIVDIETTGLLGEPEAHVVEIGIVRLIEGEIIPVYSSIVAPYYEITEDIEKAWVFQNTSLTLNQVKAGRPLEKVIREVRWALDGQPATSYNYQFDFCRFLHREPWGVCNKELPCIMRAAGAAYADRLPCSQYSGCPSCQSTYSYLCPDNPAGIPGGIEEHRALSDAIVEGFILKEMIRRGDYEPY